MRVFIPDRDMDLEALASSVARNARTVAATLERVRALNPHLADARRIPKGGLVLLPEGPDVKPDAGSSTSGQHLGELARELRDGLRELSRRATQYGDAQLNEHASLRDALKGATARRLLEGDAQLRKRLTAAEARFKADQKRAAETQEQLDEVQKIALAEFEKLQKMLER